MSHSKSDFFKQIKKVSENAAEVVKPTDLKENTKYNITECAKFITKHGPAILLTFTEDGHSDPQKMWLPRRIAKIILQSDESFEAFAEQAIYFHYLGVVSKMVKLKFKIKDDSDDESDNNDSGYDTVL